MDKREQAAAVVARKRGCGISVARKIVSCLSDENLTAVVDLDTVPRGGDAIARLIGKSNTPTPPPSPRSKPAKDKPEKPSE